MNEIIGELIPLALGVAISPVPVGAAVLILMSPRPRGISVGFLVGWVVGIIVAISLFTALAALIPPSDPDEPRPILGTIKILLGLALVWLAARGWRRRSRDGTPVKAPGWMSMMSNLTVVRAIGLGFLLAAFNPVDTLMAIAAGVDVGSAALDGGQIVTAIAVFTVIGASTVAIPVIAYLIAPHAMAPKLAGMRAWLVRYNATVTIVLLLVVGVALVGKGLGAF